MRILYVWDWEYPWDIRTQKICSALTSAGHKVHITARNREWDETREELPEGVVHRLRPWRLLGRRLDALASFPAFLNPRWAAHLHRLTAGLKPRVIIVRDLPLCPTAIWIGARHDVPVVLDMAENYPEMIRDVWRAGRQKPWDLAVRNPRLVTAVERYCLARVDHVLVVVEESGERIHALGMPEERISVVSNTPPRARAGEASEAAGDWETNGRLELVYLGLMEIPRGVHLAIEAVAQLKEDGAGPAPTLTLIGEGRDREEFEDLAARLGLTDEDVTFLGFVPNERALEIVAGADAGLVPHLATESWNTTVPNKLFDYMAAGLPVISSDARPCARILGETGSGVVFRSGDSRDLARRIVDLEDPEVRRRRGRAGLRAVRERFNWERAEDSLENAVRKAFARRRGGPE